MPPTTGYPELNEERHVSLCEALDRALNTGVVVAGDVVISVADIELIYLNLRLMVTSVETMRQQCVKAEAEAEEAAEVAV